MAKEKEEMNMAKEKEEMNMAKEIDAKYLKGLTFRGSNQRKVKGAEGEKEKTINVPFERPLTVEDVLDWKDTGKAVVIVTADGQKHRIAKGKEKE